MVYTDTLHGRYDNPIDVSASIACIVHSRVYTVLSIVFIAVLCATSNIVEMLTIRIDEFDGCTVAVNVDYRPQRTASLYTTEEYTFFLAVDTEMYVTGRCDVVKEYSVTFGESLGQCFCPITGFVGQIWTGVTW